MIQENTRKYKKIQRGLQKDRGFWAGSLINVENI